MVPVAQWYNAQAAWSLISLYGVGSIHMLVTLFFKSFFLSFLTVRVSVSVRTGVESWLSGADPHGSSPGYRDWIHNVIYWCILRQYIVSFFSLFSKNFTKSTFTYIFCILKTCCRNHFMKKFYEPYSKLKWVELKGNFLSDNHTENLLQLCLVQIIVFVTVPQ